jgi:hypothetical protein
MHVHLALRTHGIVSMITHVHFSRVSLTVTSLSDGTVAETASAASTRGSLAGASERKVTSMSIPNIGPEHAGPGDHDGVEIPRRRNPPIVYRDEPSTDDVTAATARASTVTHRFGGVRYALTRPDFVADDHRPPAEEGDSDARD